MKLLVPNFNVAIHVHVLTHRVHVRDVSNPLVRLRCIQQKNIVQCQMYISFCE